MAKMPPAASTAAPADDDTDDSMDDTGAAPADDSGADDQDDDTSDDVLVTITAGPNGGYVVYDGDEPDQDSGEGEDDADAGADGSAAPAAGADDGSEPEGKPCDSLGAALKAAMDILKEHEKSDSGSGSAASNFDAGFSGSAAPPAAAAPMQQKY